jgi:hypothetical protein
MIAQIQRSSIPAQGSIATYIGAAVWKSQGDIRDVISIGKLIRKSDGPREIEQILNTMAKYRNDDVGARKRDT